MDNIQKILPTIPVGNKLYYPIDDASVVAGVKTHTMRRLTYVREIRFLDHPKGLLFLPEWIDEWLEHRTKEPKKKQR